MKNLTINNASHPGRMDTVKNGNPLSNANLNDLDSLLDSLFLTQLDSASMALSNPSPDNTGTKNPSKETLADSQDALNKDVNSLNLVDAMELAASQALLQSPVPTSKNDTNFGNSLSSSLQLSSIGLNNESLSDNTRVGIANQNLLNILNGAVPQNLTNIPNSLNTVSLTNASNLVPNTPIKDSLQDMNTSSENAQNLNPLGINIAVDKLMNPVLKDLKVQEISSSSLQSQPIAANQDIKVANISDALKSIGDVKVISVDQSFNKLSATQSLKIDNQQNQTLDSVDVASSIPDSNTIKQLPINQTSKETSEDKKSFEDFSGVSSGFMMNPGFTNHTNHEVSLKLEAVNTSLTSGPLHSELISAAKSGGGRISLEVNPDNTGPIRIDLQIDQGGQARLMVHGASESTQARLEQGGDQLRQQFAQMGLQLSLDMRQNSANNAFSQPSNDSTNQFSNNQSQQIIASSTNSNRIGNENLLGANQQLSADKSNGINLFA